MTTFNTSDWIPPKTFKQFMKQTEDYASNPDTQVVNMSYEELWTDTTTPIFEIVRRAFLNGESFAKVMGGLLKEIRSRDRGEADDWFLDCCLDFIGSLKTLNEVINIVTD
jgi:hypothetical protein